MADLFNEILNMSINASWLILAVMLIRLVFAKAPKWIRGIMWAMVGFKLIIPFSLETALSLLPSAKTIPQEIIHSNTPDNIGGTEILGNGTYAGGGVLYVEGEGMGRAAGHIAQGGEHQGSVVTQSKAQAVDDIGGGQALSAHGFQRGMHQQDASLSHAQGAGVCGDLFYKFVHTLKSLKILVLPVGTVTSPERVSPVSRSVTGFWKV